MIDNYFKQIEEIITPKSYSKNDFAKILNKNDKNEKNRTINTNKSGITNSEINASLIQNNLNYINNNEEGKSSMIIKRVESISSQNKSKKDLLQSLFKSQNLNNSTQLNQMSDDKNYEIFKQIITEEQKKNMQLRHELTELNKQVETLKQTNKENQVLIQKLEREKQSDSKYLIKLENLLSSMKQNNNELKVSTTMFKESFGITNLNSPMQTIPTPNSTYFLEDRKERENLEKIVQSLTKENERLNHFQKSIYEISHVCDEINNNVMNNLKEIEDILQNINEKGDLDNWDISSLKSIFILFDK
jgi:hypothetical protein